MNCTEKKFCDLAHVFFVEELIKFIHKPASNILVLICSLMINQQRQKHDQCKC